MKVKMFPSGSIQTNCYIVFDRKTKAAFCVDVSDRLEYKYFDFISANGLNVKYLLLTHGHYDHTQDVLQFKKNFADAKIAISKKDYDNILNATEVFCPPCEFVTPDILFEGGDKLEFLSEYIEIIATPGHTNGSVCFKFRDMLFCGDTVFYGSIGRTDMPTGSFTEILSSVKKINALGNLKLYPGHMQTTDIKTQRIINPYFNL